jgi:diguanylate cyclase (GGDEF)-like protein
MFNRLRETLSPKIQPDLIRYRIRLARYLIIAFFLLLGGWLIVAIANKIILDSENGYPFVLDIISIVVFSFLGAGTLWLISHQRLGGAGYLLASTFFAAATLGLILFPQAFYVMSATYMISIITAGALVGGGSTFLFAVSGSIAISFNWYKTWGTSLNPAHEFDPATSLLILGSQILLFIGTAAILHSLSNQVQKTIDQLHEQADRLVDLAQTDPLTGLPNRRYFIEILAREFARARRYHRPLTLLYLDLDEFKELNDKHGHLFGDEILRGASRSLKAVLRSTDLLARIGGDEFAVLLPETNLGGAQNVASKLRRALMAFGQQISPIVPPLTFCGGISQMREGDSSIDDMLARADSAQYLAKDLGKDDTRTEMDLESTPQIDA